MTKRIFGPGILNNIIILLALSFCKYEKEKVPLTRFKKFKVTGLSIWLGIENRTEPKPGFLFERNRKERPIVPKKNRIIFKLKKKKKTNQAEPKNGIDLRLISLFKKKYRFSTEHQSQN